MWPSFLPNLFTYFAVGERCDLPGRGDNPFFGFPHWWQYLEGKRAASGICEPFVKMPDGLWAIGFGIIDILLYLGGIVAVVSIIISGVMYLTSGGNTETATSARKRIINSLVGLAFVIFASALVSFAGNSIG